MPEVSCYSADEARDRYRGSQVQKAKGRGNVPPATTGPKPLPSGPQTVKPYVRSPSGRPAPTIGGDIAPAGPKQPPRPPKQAGPAPTIGG